MTDSLIALNAIEAAFRDGEAVWALTDPGRTAGRIVGRRPDGLYDVLLSGCARPLPLAAVHLAPRELVGLLMEIEKRGGRKRTKRRLADRHARFSRE